MKDLDLKRSKMVFILAQFLLSIELSDVEIDEISVISRFPADIFSKYASLLETVIYRNGYIITGFYRYIIENFVFFGNFQDI